MTDIKFTPAPWKIDRHRFVRTIASIGPLQADKYAGSAWIECSEEDASLAAAAPDLYEALERSIDMLQDYARDYKEISGSNEVHPIHKEIIDQAEKALAKARGES
jgi:hypothetical protein